MWGFEFGTFSEPGIANGQKFQGKKIPVKSSYGPHIINGRTLRVISLYARVII